MTQIVASSTQPRYFLSVLLKNFTITRNIWHVDGLVYSGYNDFMVLSCNSVAHIFWKQGRPILNVVFQILKRGPSLKCHLSFGNFWVSISQLLVTSSELQMKSWQVFWIIYRIKYLHSLLHNKLNDCSSTGRVEWLPMMNVISSVHSTL